MGIKFGSVVVVAMVMFLAKVSIETAMAEKVTHKASMRSPASIDQSYNDHMMKNSRAD